jgi:hypothetical protein
MKQKIAVLDQMTKDNDKMLQKLSSTLTKKEERCRKLEFDIRSERKLSDKLHRDLKRVKAQQS